MRPGDRVIVAVSGGADSVALLRILLELRPELGLVLAVAHFNHQLRGDQSEADEAFVAELAKEHGLEFYSGRAQVREHSLTNKLSLEAAARELRYRWLSEIGREHRFDCIATAHTGDDQVETVLLKFLRGAGTKGLAGIYPVLNLNTGAEAPPFQEGPNDAPEGAPLPGNLAKPGGRLQALCRIVRPLLCVSRDDVEAYLTSLNQSWREDETNLDRRFLRNRVRHELLPLLEREYNPSLRTVLQDLAELARGEEEYWETVVQQNSANAGDFPLRGFGELPVALQRRLLRRFVEQHGVRTDFRHIEKLRRCALGERSRAELSGGRIVARQNDRLRLCEPEPRVKEAYQFVLPVPGEAKIPALGLTLRAMTVTAEFARESPSGTLLNGNLLNPELTVRNWLPGDRFRPAHRRSDEKLKRIFTEQRIPPEQRSMWPVVLNGEDIVWVQGLPVASAYRWTGDGDAVRIESHVVGSS